MEAGVAFNALLRLSVMTDGDLSKIAKELGLASGQRTTLIMQIMENRKKCEELVLSPLVFKGDTCGSNGGRTLENKPCKRAMCLLAVFTHFFYNVYFFD